MFSGLVLSVQLVHCRPMPCALRLPDSPARCPSDLPGRICLWIDRHVGRRSVSVWYILCGCKQRANALFHWVLLQRDGLVDAHPMYCRLVLRCLWSLGAKRKLRGRLLLRDWLEHVNAGAVLEYYLLSSRQCHAGRVSDFFVLPERGNEHAHCLHSRHVLRHVGAVVADWLVQWWLFLRGRVELGDSESLFRWVLLPFRQLSGDRVPRARRVCLAGTGELHRVPERFILQRHWSLGSVWSVQGRIFLSRGLCFSLAAAVSSRLVLSCGEQICHCLSDIVFLSVDWPERRGALHGRLFLQSIRLVSRVGRLQRWLLLSDRVVIGDATCVPSAFVLPGAQSQHDGVARVVLLPCERHERAERVRCGCFLQSDGPECRVWTMQRWVLLRRWLVDCDAVFVHQWHILPDRQLQYHHLSARSILSCARAGQLHAVSERKFLQCHGSVCIHAVYSRAVLPNIGSECSDWHLQCRLLLPDGLECDESGFVSAHYILPRRQCCCYRVSRFFVLRQHGHERACAVHAGLVLRCDRSLGAEWKLQSGLLLRDGLEHGHSKPVLEGQLLSSGQLSSDRESRIRLLRVEWHGELHALYGRVLLQPDWSVGRVGRLRRGLLLPDRVNVCPAVALSSALVLHCA